MRLRNIPGAKEIIAQSPYVVHNPQEQKGRWNQFFPQAQPLCIEVGMGKGRFLMDKARLHPEINYVGIEMYGSVLLRAIQKRWEREELPNLYFMCVDAKLLPDIFARGEVDKIYVNFPDPWPKARHAKRRLTSREFLARYDKILCPGGILRLKTDNEDLFNFSLEEVSACEKLGWQVFTTGRDFRRCTSVPKGRVVTEYEEKFILEGRPIYKYYARRDLP